MTFEDVFRRHQRVQDLARSLLGLQAFDQLHVTIPDPTRPEAGFIRATSWLCCLYFEAGRVSLTFLRKVGEAYSLIEGDSAEEHIVVVRCLRTELHHNLGFADSDHAARSAAERWRRRACGTAIPEDDGQWQLCYDCLIRDASRFLGSIDSVVRRIEADADHAQLHIDEWRQRLQRSWPAASFDPVVEEVKYRLGRDALNTVEFRQRYVGRWRKHLALLEDGFNFEFEVTRLVEKTLLDEDIMVLPITGRDIMEAFSLTPGPRVGELLELARSRFLATGCTKDELIAHLRNSS